MLEFLNSPLGLTVVGGVCAMTGWLGKATYNVLANKSLNKAQITDLIVKANETTLTGFQSLIEEKEKVIASLEKRLDNMQGEVEELEKELKKANKEIKELTCRLNANKAFGEQCRKTKK